MNRRRFAQIFNRSVPWLPAADAPFIAVSTRIRLARNLAGLPFPRRASPEERREILARMADAAPGALGPARDVLQAEISQFQELERRLLVERRLISRELAHGGVAAGVILAADERTGLLVNEEDHLRIQALVPGLDLRAAQQLADQVDTALSAKLEFAFDPELGFLTACPSNVGTGMRASVMLHLPALVLSGQLEAVMRGAQRLNFTFRGIFGEGSEAVGNMFQFSNQSTLGESEACILERLETAVNRLIRAEEAARQRLVTQRQTALYDRVGKAYGVLRYGYSLDSKEVLNYLSLLLVGCDTGILPSVSRKSIEGLMVLCQPGHLQKLAGKTLDDEARDAYRAEIVRNALSAPPAGPRRS